MKVINEKLRKCIVTGLFLITGSLLFISCNVSDTDALLAGEEEGSVTIDLLGQRHEVTVDSSGRAVRNYEFTSADQLVTITIDKNTVFSLGSADGAQFIQVVAITDMPDPPQNAQIIGSAYTLLPEIVKADPPLKLTISYDHSKIPLDISEGSVYIAPYTSDAWGSWSFKRVDTDKHRVTTRVDRFSTFAVIVPLQPVPVATVEKRDLTSIPLVHALSSGKPTLAEFGSVTCEPCKEMKPILENLAIEYEGRLNVVIIDVYDEPELGSKYGIIAMPTQILFDSLGREVSRHPGFFPKAGIIAELKKVGI